MRFVADDGLEDIEKFVTLNFVEVKLETEAKVAAGVSYNMTKPEEVVELPEEQEIVFGSWKTYPRVKKSEINSESDLTIEFNVMMKFGPEFIE